MIHAFRPLLAAAALATLAACSATHVGESWQCPLAQGPGCSTVAGADPALPRETVAAAPLPGAPLYRPRDAGGAEPSPRAERRCDSDCEDGFGPFAWLAGLLRTIAGTEERPGRAQADTGGSEGADAASAAPALPGAEEPPSSAPLAADSMIPAAATGAETSVASGAPSLPPAPVADEAALREPEVIGRIWIAPFVDADGHYREGAWVRTVLEPAGWRVP